MKNIDDINIHTWFTERELDYVPGHFVVVNTPILDEAKIWILERLTGRFAIVLSNDGSFLAPDNLYPAFEDPKEAVFYELTWS
jgi:hypothetical protein